jgi:hypothetical protein
LASQVDNLTSDVKSFDTPDPRNLKTTFSFRHRDLLEKLKDGESEDNRQLVDSAMRNLQTSFSMKHLDILDQLN